MDSLALNDVRIVLVGTTHPGNIGATARAMKTMRQDKLYLVKPKHYPSAAATAMAAGADDVLANAVVGHDIKGAIADCELVIASTSRRRSLAWPTVTPRECAAKIIRSGMVKTAILFGREDSGLSNTELELSNLMLQIPASSEYPSLNLAAAVQIVCYELMIAAMGVEETPCSDTNEEYVTQDKMEQFYAHLEQCMTDLKVLDHNNPRRLMHRMHRLFNRARLDQSEWRILRGFLARIQEKRDQ